MNEKLHRILSAATLVLLAVSFIAVCPSAYSQTIYRLAGKEYHLATDELFKMSGKDAGVIKIEPITLPADVITTASLLLARARELAAASGIPHELVVYSHPARTRSSRHVLSDRFLVKVSNEKALKSVLALPGVVAHKALPASQNTYSVAIDSSVSNVIAGMIAAESLPGVEQVTPEYYAEKTLHLVPTDPFYSEQWHLKNNGDPGFTAGVDINVEQAWDTVNGEGVVVVIVDSGLDTDHEDLSNYDATFGYDWIDTPEDGDPRPTVPPVMDDSWHGTAMAGLTAASANNPFGGAGVAFEAELGAYRLIAPGATISDFAEAFVRQNAEVDIKNNSWGFDFDGDPWELGTVPGVELDAIRDAVNDGRGGLGTVLVFSAGNRGPGSDVNYSGYPALVETIAVNALTGMGMLASYCSQGACLTVSTPADEVFTTDISGTGGANTAVDGDYTLSNGTSSAAAILSGVIALMLEKNPSLGWRDVQEILMRTAKKINPSDSDWQTNGSGINYNHKYGAGLVDAKAACDLAVDWPVLGSRVKISEALPAPIFIPDLSTVEIPVDFTGRGLRVERAELVVTTLHEYPGDLVITLVSPSGTRGVLKRLSLLDSSENLNDYKFTTTCHWGENASGVWRVIISDELEVYQGSVSIALNLLGTPAAGSGPPGSGSQPIDYEGGISYAGGIDYKGGRRYRGGSDYQGGIDYSGGVAYTGTGSYVGRADYTRGGLAITVAPSSASSNMSMTPPKSSRRTSSITSALSPAPTANLTPAISPSAMHINELLHPGQKVSRNALSLKAAGSARSKYFSASTNVPWLKVSPSEGRVSNLETPLVVHFDGTNLKPGVHTSDIEIRWGSRSLDKVIVPVTLKIVAPGLRVVFGEGPVRVRASMDHPKATGTFRINGFGSESRLYEIRSDAAWLRADSPFGAISPTLPVLQKFKVDATGLPVGVHEANLLCKIFGSEKVQKIPVTLIVEPKKLERSD